MTLTLKNSNKSFEPNEYLNWPLTLYIRPSTTTGRIWIIASTSVILTNVILVISFISLLNMTHNAPSFLFFPLWQQTQHHSERRSGCYVSKGYRDYKLFWSPRSINPYGYISEPWVGWYPFLIFNQFSVSIFCADPRIRISTFPEGTWTMQHNLCSIV